ncbi:MAG: CHASE2 domain-containing protein [Geitlerinemataceae cyanobacterium]
MLESNLLVTAGRWKQILLTILTVTGVAIVASGIGLFHHQEWSMLDLFFRWRPGEPIDPRIVLVTIDESDVGRNGQWPLPDPVLEELLETLKSQHPRAIGLDLYREFPDAILSEREDDGDPAILSRNPIVDRLDFPVDGDGRVRRSWISVRTESGETNLNFGLSLSLEYLKSDGITLEPLNESRSRYRLGQTVLVPLSGNDGDYLWGNDDRNRLLMNYRGTSRSFHRISLSEVLDGNIPPDLMRDRLILVGAVAARWSPSFYTPYSNSSANTPQRTSELVIHANIASQILSAALDGRPMLKVLSEPAKGLWIFVWSAIGVAVGLTWLQARILEENLALKLAFLSLGLAGMGMLSIGFSYVAFLRGWWLPASAPISALIGSAVTIAILQINELQQEKTDLEMILEAANNQGDLIQNGLLEKYTQEVALESYTTAIQLMDVLPVGIAFIDTSGTVCYTNTRAKQLLGREPTRPISSEEIPEFYQIYLAGTDRLYPHEEFTGLQALQGKSMRADNMEVRNNNKIVPLECWGTPIYDDRGHIQYAILVLQDITDRRQAYAERILFHQELETKTIALQEMEKLKDEFLKRTSHELRTPLNGIIGSIQLILDGFCENREEEVEFLEQAKGSSQSLLTLINNLLDLNQIQSGDFALNLEAVDLQACLTKAIYLHLYTLQQKNLSLFKSYASEPIVVRADSLRLTQVLVNLIGNAIKFTEQGSITIKTELKSKTDANNREFVVGTVTVCDTGIGIEPQVQKQMFEAFRMEDGSTTRKYGGIGLGLTISQKFIKRMGGQLTLTSEGKGCGTTLEVSLPLALSSAGSQLSDVPEQKQTLVERS